MSAEFNQVLADFLSEASVVCGSEGLYQSIFYHQARRHFSQDQIKREVSAAGGRVDFLLEGADRFFAIELKAGANGHRNSLDNITAVQDSRNRMSGTLS